MNRVFIQLIKNVLIVILVVLTGCTKVSVRFEVTVQENPESVFITGNHQELGIWSPGQVEMKKLSDSLFTHQIDVESGTNLEYKFTRGSWDTEAIYGTDIIPGNHILTVRTDTMLAHTVKKWRDVLVLSHDEITGRAVYHKDFYSPELNNNRTVLV